MAHKDPWDAAVELADHHAPFLRRLLRSEADIPDLLKSHGPEPVLKTLHEQLQKIDPGKISPDNLMQLLRDCRGRAALVIALADLAHVWSVDQVTAALSQFADRCIQAAVQTAIAQALKAKRLPLTPALKRAPRATQMASHGLACLALGKLGGRELNYSSDVDLIFLFDETRVSENSDATESYSRVVHEAARYLQQSTSDGYALRVDLRLRPDPGATPPAISMAAAENYYQSAALTWERAAYTRARACAGDLQAGNAFLQRMSGWIWRRSLDFTAIEDIHALREQILEHFNLEDFDPAGFDVKRGIGGIREIEFLLQIHQLIHGGRQPALRTSHTPAGLQRLAEHGFITAKQANALTESYHWLRRTEHRLQMMHDAQTHEIPANTSERAAVATFCGDKSLAAFEKQLKTVCHNVRKNYLHILGRDKQPALAAKTISRKIQNIDAYVTRWQSGRYKSLTHPRARAALEKMTPALIDILAKAPEPEAALLRWDRFLESLPSGVSLLEMLHANPKLLQLIARIMGLSASTGEQLARHPQLLDAVLDRDFFDAIADPPTQLAAMTQTLSDGEAIWSATARWVAEKRFQLSVQLLDGLVTVHDAIRQHARVMDAVVTKILSLADADLSRSHGRFQNNRPIVLALGGWGGDALGLKSDLDMVLLFSGAHDAVSDGARPITAVHYFNKLAPRLINLLTATSSDGAIADVDTRLRPSGAKGLLAVSVESFLKYQLEDAWTWEHMALTRARRVTGPAEEFSTALRSIFAIRRDDQKLLADILDMRAEMDAHRSAKSVWDMKLPPGGLIDIEFILQALQLRHAGTHPDIIQPSLEAAVHALAAQQFLSAAQAKILSAAWHLQATVRTILSLCEHGDATETVSGPVAGLLARATSQKSLALLEKSIQEARQNVLDIWQTVFKQPRRI